MTGFERNPWAITEQDFPVAGSVEEQLRFLLGYAILAPSSHNSQPWQFRIDAASAPTTQIDLLADRSRRLGVVDPEDYAIDYQLRRGAVQSTAAGPALFRVPAAGGAIPRSQRPVIVGTGPCRTGWRGLTRGVGIARGHPTLDHEPCPLCRPARVRGSAGRARGSSDGRRRLVSCRCRRAGATIDCRSHRGRGPRAVVQPRLSPGAGLLDAPDHTHARDGMPGTGFGMGELESLVAPLLIRTFDMGGCAAKGRTGGRDFPGDRGVGYRGRQRQRSPPRGAGGGASAAARHCRGALGLLPQSAERGATVAPSPGEHHRAGGLATDADTLRLRAAGHAHAALAGCRCAHRLRARRISTRQGHLHGSQAA